MKSYVFITVQSDMILGTYDLEVPVNVPVRQLCRNISEVLTAYTERTVSCNRLYSVRKEKELDGSSTFEQLGIWNGDMIELKN